MGGSGAIVFCGRNRYQLIASKRYDGTGQFGFTLVRKHPLADEERQKYKNTWYEFLTIDGAIPAFECGELDLGLYRRQFSTGTVIKLYSYDLPSGITHQSGWIPKSMHPALKKGRQGPKNNNDLATL